MDEGSPAREDTAPAGFGRVQSAVRPAAFRLWVWIYVGAVSAAALALAVGRPIVAVDHDLWFHLAHGRTVVEEGEIPGDSYFSFLSPPREGIDYYWLFQALAYGTHAAAGYAGVVALRALLYGGLLLCVAAILFRGGRRLGGSAGTGAVWQCLAFGLVAVYFLQRTATVRPHSLSFLLIALFLVILEGGGRRVLALPALALLWTNVHGIEFPVMLLILGAYAAELLVGRRWPGSSPGPAGRTRTLLAVALAMAMVFATPHGFALVRLPFQSTGSISWVIEEMERLPVSEYLKLEVSGAGISSATQFNLLLALAALGALACLVRKRARPSHLALFAGGLVLVTQGYRFTFECALLALPILRSGARALEWPALPAGARRLPAAALAAVLLALPVLSIARRLPDVRGPWPLSLHNLPHGLVSFLRQSGVEGTVMNPPRSGGYLFWSLYPDFRISMDLEMAFLFDARDLFEVESAYRDPAALARYLERWRPSFIAAPLEAARFPDLVRAHPRYRPVFFDDTHALYVDAGRHPELAERWRLEVVDPFTAATRFSGLPPPALQAVRRELERISEVDPRIGVVERSQAILAHLQGRYRDGLVHAERVVKRDPLAAQGHALVGDALTGLGRHGDAAAAYRRALRRARDDAERRSIQLSLAGVLNAQGRFDEAYAAMVAAVGEFNVDLPSRELYRLGVLAARSGQTEKARRHFELARWTAPPDDDAWLRRLDAALATLPPGR